MSAPAKLFYGWWVVAACALGAFLSPGAVVVFSFSVFIKPLVLDFHTGRAAISLAFTLHNVISAMFTPLSGLVIDRVGPRKVLLTCTAIFAVFLLSSELLPARIIYLYFFFAALGLITGAIGPVPNGVLISRWFDRLRGRALGLMMIGLGLGAIALPFFAHRIITLFGWRAAYATAGCAVLLFCFPVLALVLKDDPREKGLLPDGAFSAPTSPRNKEQLPGLSWHEVWHQRTFWLLICIFFLAGASVHACILHMTPLLSDRGISPQGAALATSLVGVAFLFGRVGTGYLLDYFFAPRLAAILFACASVGIALLALGSTGNLAFFAAFLVGLGMGAEVDLIAYCMSRYFGLRAFGISYGLCFSAFVLAGALGAYIMGLGFDLTHSYTWPLRLFFLFLLTAAALMTGVGPYRYAPALRDEHRQLEPVAVGSHV
jgi:MFS family permease